jgi:hypothetical protein
MPVQCPEINPADMKGRPIRRNCKDCAGADRRHCDIRRLFRRLHVPLREQTALISAASEKKMTCEGFRQILLFLLRGRGAPSCKNDER